MTERIPWTWESWMEPYRSSIFLPSGHVVEDEIDDEVVQAQIGLLVALRYEPTLAVDGEVPRFTVPYSDRFALPLLATRKALAEEYGLMRQAREIEEQARQVHEWQLANIDQLTPSPGVIPVQPVGSVRHYTPGDWA